MTGAPAGSATRRPALGVVIPTRDKADRLELTLRSLARQCDPPATEVVVVNDGSTDHTPDVTAAATADGLNLRTVPGPCRGRAAARNRGAAAITAARVVFLDDDIVVSADFLAAHGLAGSAAYPDDPAARRVLHGPLRETPRASAVLAQSPNDPYRELAAGTFGRTPRNSLERLVCSMADGSAPPVAPWLACVGANVSMEHATWAAHGGFDEDFGLTWGCEDLEFGYRLHLAGARIRLAPAAAGFHLSHARPDRWEQHARNLDRFARLHPDPAVRLLDHLLSNTGSPDRYLSLVAQSDDGSRSSSDRRALP